MLNTISFDYTPHIPYIVAHYNKDMRSEDIAAYLGVTNRALRAQVRRLKDRGIQIAEKGYNKPVPIGTISMHSRGSRSVKMIKTVDGWEYVKDGQRGRPKLPERPKPVNVDKPVKVERKPNQKPPKIPIPKKPKPITQPVQFKPMATKRDPQKTNHAGFTHKNPEKFKIMSDAEKIAAGWKYVRLNEKTMVLRHPDKINKTA